MVDQQRVVSNFGDGDSGASKITTCDISRGREVRGAPLPTRRVSSLEVTFPRVRVYFAGNGQETTRSLSYLRLLTQWGFDCACSMNSSVQ